MYKNMTELCSNTLLNEYLLRFITDLTDSVKCNCQHINKSNPNLKT